MVEQKVDEKPVRLLIDNKDLLSQFYNLVSLDESVRIKSVVNVVNNLKSSQKQTDLEYTLQRLVKGLGSSRKAARQGYATALTHLIAEFKDVTTDEILKLLAENLLVTGSSKGHEERDNYFGQVFGFIAIVKARIKTDMDGDLLKTVIESLLKLSKKKSYLQEICCKAILDILPMVDVDSFSEHVLPVLEPSLKQGWSKCTPETLLLTLKVREEYKDLMQEDENLFTEHWGEEDILDASNLKKLSHVLMDTTNTAHPRVHILWDTVIKYIFDKNDKEYTEEFWNVVVEDNLMQSTFERKFLAVKLLLIMSAQAPSSLVGIFYSKHLMRCIINSCQSKENYLFNAVKDMLKKLPHKVSENPDKLTCFEIIKCLVGSNGNVLFDLMTHTKTVEDLLLKLEVTLVDYFLWLKEVFKQGCTDTLDTDNTKLLEKNVNNCRTWVANQLYVLIRCCKLRNDEDLLTDVLNFIFLHCYFDLVKKSSKITHLNALIVESHIVPVTTFQQRFLSCLTDITHFYGATQNKGSKVRDFGGVAADGDFLALKVLHYAQKLLQNAKYVTLKEAWTPEYHDAFEKSMLMIENMDAEDDSGSVSKAKGTQLIFIHTTLQLFSSKPEAVEILEDLHTCYSKAEEKKKKKKTEPHWTEVLVEILLGYLLQPSHLLRQVVDMVFPSIAQHLTQEAFYSLLQAIKPKKESEDDGIELEDESDAEAEIKSQEEKQTKEGESKEENGVHESDASDDDDEEEEEDSEDDEDVEEDDMEVDTAFKAELKNALGDSAVNSEEENSDNSDDDVDIDMDACDEKLLRQMDQALAAVFKARQDKEEEKKTKKSMKLSILHFKLRVLDLVEIFIKKYPKDPKIIILVEPLLEVLKSSHGHVKELVLFDRTLGIYKNKLCQLHEYPSGVDLNVEEVHSQIERLISLAKTASSALFVNYITNGIVYLIRVLRGNPEIKGPSPLKTRSQRKRKGETNEEKVKIEDDHVGCLDENRLISSLKEALTEFMTKRSSHLQPSLFVETINRFPELGWKLINVLPPHLNNGCNNFRKVKACEMLKLIFSKKTKTFPDYFAELAPLLQDCLCKAFDATKMDDYTLKARQFHDIVHLADIFMKEASKIDTVKDIIDKPKLQQCLTNALDSDVVSRSSSLHSYCQKFLKSLDNDQCNGTKTKKKKKKT